MSSDPNTHFPSFETDEQQRWYQSRSSMHKNNCYHLDLTIVRPKHRETVASYIVPIKGDTFWWSTFASMAQTTINTSPYKRLCYKNGAFTNDFLAVGASIPYLHSNRPVYKCAFGHFLIASEESNTSSPYSALPHPDWSGSNNHFPAGKILAPKFYRTLGRKSAKSNVKINEGATSLEAQALILLQAITDISPKINGAVNPMITVLSTLKGTKYISAGTYCDMRGNGVFPVESKDEWAWFYATVKKRRTESSNVTFANMNVVPADYHLLDQITEFMGDRVKKSTIYPCNGFETENEFYEKFNHIRPREAATSVGGSRVESCVSENSEWVPSRPVEFSQNLRNRSWTDQDEEVHQAYLSGLRNRAESLDAEAARYLHDAKIALENYVGSEETRDYTDFTTLIAHIKTVSANWDKPSQLGYILEKYIYDMSTRAFQKVFFNRTETAEKYNFFHPNWLDEENLSLTTGQKLTLRREFNRTFTLATMYKNITFLMALLKEWRLEPVHNELEQIDSWKTAVQNLVYQYQNAPVRQ